jgi:hypothetical protein
MVKKPLPEFVPPMMANSVKEPFDSPDWIFEAPLAKGELGRSQAIPVRIL